LRVGAMLDEVRAAVIKQRSPKTSTGVRLCKLPNPNEVFCPCLSIVVYCDRGMLCLRYNGTYVNAPNFDPHLAWNALHDALVWCDATRRRYDDAEEPSKPGADWSEPGWIREDAFEVILIINILPDGRLHFKLKTPMYIPWPRFVLRLALGEATDALASYYSCLLAKANDQPLLYLEDGHFGMFLEIGFLGEDKGWPKELAEHWCADIVEGPVAQFEMLMAVDKPKEEMLSVKDAIQEVKRYRENGRMRRPGYAVVNGNEFIIPQYTDEVGDVSMPKSKGKKKNKKKKKKKKSKGESKPLEDEDAGSSSSESPAPPEPATFTSLPSDILEEIADYFQNRDLYVWDRREQGMETLSALSMVCKRFRLVFQPMLFRKVIVRDSADVVSPLQSRSWAMRAINMLRQAMLYEILNGGPGMVFKEMPEDADEETQFLVRLYVSLNTAV
jgi:hypothetical protein